MRRVSQALPGPAVWLRVVTIVPDAKDWTWVLQRPCPECGLDTHSFPRDAIAGMIRVNAAAWLAYCPASQTFTGTASAKIPSRQ